MNKVYGVVGIRSIMANWNADFTGSPKTTSEGKIFGSDKALKYVVRRHFLNKGLKVLYMKGLTYSEKTGEVGAQMLEERYQDVFGEEVGKKKEGQNSVIENLFLAEDIMQFGAAFAVKGHNLSISGAVQFGQGMNKYEETNIESQSVLSPFINSNSKDAKQTSLGSMIFSDEAHYVYPFSINPIMYQNYIKMGVTEGYQEKNYERLKEALRIGASAFHTVAKTGVDNELAVFIETDNDVYFPDLSQFVRFEKDGDKNIYHLEFFELLNEQADSIKSIQIYYNDLDILVKYETSLKVDEFNIFSEKPIER